MLKNALIQGRRVVATALGAIALGVGCSSANAGVTIPELEVFLQVNDGEVNHLYPIGVPTEDPNQFLWEGDYSGQGWAMSLDILGDIDPFLNSTIGITNNTDATQIYTVTVVLPTTPIGPGSFMGASIGGSVTDSNADGTATVSTLAGSALFTGLIDGSSALTLYDFPASFSAPFAGGTGAIAPLNVGLPGPTLPGPSVTSDIGIQLQFSLTPGDSVAITSFFQVEPVPAPAALALLGMAGLVGSRRRR